MEEHKIHYSNVIMSEMASEITSLNRLFRRRSKKASKLRVTGLCVGNSPVTGEFLAQRASNAENVSIWWRHHAKRKSTFHLVLIWTTKAIKGHFDLIMDN